MGKPVPYMVWRNTIVRCRTALFQYFDTWLPQYLRRTIGKRQLSCFVSRCDTGLTQ